MPSRPVIRTAVTKAVLGVLERHDPHGAEVLDAIDEHVRTVVDAQLGLSWLPLEHHLHVIDVIHGARGADGLRDLFVEVYLLGITELAAVRALINATLRMLAPSPQNTAKQLGRAWASLSRDTGRFGPPTPTGPRSFEIELSELNDLMLDAQRWVHTFEGTFIGFGRQVDRQTRAECMPIDRDGRSIRFRVEWT